MSEYLNELKGETSDLDTFFASRRIRDASKINYGPLKTCDLNRTGKSDQEAVSEL